MRNDPYTHVGDAHKINSGSTHNSFIFINYDHRLCATRSVDELQWESFLKCYVMGATGVDFGGIAHVKVGVIAHQKI